MSHFRLATALAFTLFPLAAAHTRAADEITVSKSENITKTGPRAGDNGSRYFNIQGKNSGEDGKFACFGVLDFEVAKPEASAKPVTIKAAKLTLTQSVARFSKEGKIKFFVTDDLKTDTATLKFDPAGAESLGSQLQPRRPLGGASFKADATGHVDTFTLELDDATKAALKHLKEVGGKLRIVVVPADADVAATYFGAGQTTESHRPRLSLEVEAAP